MVDLVLILLQESSLGGHARELYRAVSARLILNPLSGLFFAFSSPLRLIWAY